MIVVKAFCLLLDMPRDFTYHTIFILKIFLGVLCSPELHVDPSLFYGIMYLLSKNLKRANLL